MNLTVSGLHFTYNHRYVLNGLDFKLEPGRILGVIGVNGAGKSTLLKCLNRILSPQKGTVWLEDQDLKGMSGPEIARHFGYVPQKYSDEPLTVFDAVLLGRKPYIKWSATPRDYQVVEDVLRRLRIEHLAERTANQLSGGELQKVIIARALAQEPEIMLLDEPTSNLDLKNQIQVIRIIRDAVREFNISTVVSLHDINLAFRFVDYFLMLKDGMVHTLCRNEDVAPENIEDVYGVKVSISRFGRHKVIIPLED